jgi:hypothetical protein
MRSACRTGRDRAAHPRFARGALPSIIYDGATYSYRIEHNSMCDSHPLTIETQEGRDLPLCGDKINFLQDVKVYIRPIEKYPNRWRHCSCSQRAECSAHYLGAAGIASNIARTSLHPRTEGLPQNHFEKRPATTGSQGAECKHARPKQNGPHTKNRRRPKEHRLLLAHLGGLTGERAQNLKSPRT